MAVDFELELVWIPVSDVDRAKRFYLEQAGFDLLVDIPNGLPGQRIVHRTGAGWRPGLKLAGPEPRSEALYGGATIRSAA